LRSRLPVADMSKFAKNGSTVTTAAVKLARAYTGRNIVLRCAQHPFFSYDDWFIGTTPAGSGVPCDTANLTLQFDYNDAEGLERILDDNRGRVACVIMEPATTNEEPARGYLETVRKLCTAHRAVLIFDEMVTGFRWHTQGGARYYGDVGPDLTTYGKAIANGFSLTALTGRQEIMELGGIRHNRDRVFLISTTHGAETIGLVAALETIRLINDLDVPSHLWRVGRLLIDGLNGAARERGLDRYVEFGGVACNPFYVCRDGAGHVSAAFKTLLMQEFIARGVLMAGPALSFSHTDEVIEDTVTAFRDLLEVYEAALHEGVEKHLVGAPVKPVFRKRN
jgi:glutamate-1-semialdehyde 2,1-aminomutase